MANESLVQPLLWRTRLVFLRGLLATLIGLGITASHLHFQTPFGSFLVPALMLLILLPSISYFFTRKNQQHRTLLNLELVSDTLFFTALLYMLGGSSNPLAFYLLIHVLVASLALPLHQAISICTLTITGYTLTGFYYVTPMEHTDLHALSHQMSPTHSLGMGVIFIAMNLTLTILGQLIQRAYAQANQQQATALKLGLQRERMYEIASLYADQAHEINTPLNTLLLLIEEIQLSDSEDDREQALAQLGQIANSLGSKLRTPPLEENPNQPVALEQLANKAATQLRHLCPAMETRFRGPLNPNLYNAPDWLRILLNLGYNAIDAGATSFQICCENLPHSPNILIRCQDDGPDHPERKEQHGLGIGLVLVDTTINALGGEWQLNSYRQWTMIDILIPDSQDSDHENTPVA